MPPQIFLPLLGVCLMLAMAVFIGDIGNVPLYAESLLVRLLLVYVVQRFTYCTFTPVLSYRRWQSKVLHHMHTYWGQFSRTNNLSAYFWSTRDNREETNTDARRACKLCAESGLVGIWTEDSSAARQRCQYSTHVIIHVLLCLHSTSTEWVTLLLPVFSYSSATSLWFPLPIPPFML